MKVPDFIIACAAAEPEIVLKTDWEMAIEGLMADIAKTRGGAIAVLENSQVGSSGSSGSSEWLREGCRGVEGLIRTHFVCLRGEAGHKSQVGGRDCEMCTKFLRGGVLAQWSVGATRAHRMQRRSSASQSRPCR